MIRTTSALPTPVDRTSERLLTAGMILIFAMFGYAKWFEYEAQALVPLIGHSPLLGWMHGAFGVRGASYALGVAEWTIGVMLILGLRWPLMAIVGAAGSTLTFASTLTLLASTPGVWKAAAGGFPAMASTASFLMKDSVLLCVSIVLLRHAWAKLRQHSHGHRAMGPGVLGAVKRAP